MIYKVHLGLAMLIVQNSDGKTVMNFILVLEFIIIRVLLSRLFIGMKN